MISTKTLQSWMAEFTYKPGWLFKVHGPSLNFPSVDNARGVYLHYSEFAIEIRAMLPDTTAVRDFKKPEGEYAGYTIPEVKVSGYRSFPLDYVHDRESFFHYVAEAILALERHEMVEWMRFGGKPVWDPHPRNDRGLLTSNYGTSSAYYQLDKS